VTLLECHVNDSGSCDGNTSIDVMTWLRQHRGLAFWLSRQRPSCIWRNDVIDHAAQLY
jgi:hypothetical protein